MINRKKILIIDPYPVFRRTLKEVIRERETHVDIIEAEHADQAKGILKNKPPQVVFMDIALPRNNGIQLIESIRGMAPNTQIVVLTNHDSAEHKEAALQKGADYFLSKERSGGLCLLDVINKTIRQQDPT